MVVAYYARVWRGQVQASLAVAYRSHASGAYQLVSTCNNSEPEQHERPA